MTRSLTDKDSIDGPFDRAMAAAMREDRRAEEAARKRLEHIEALTLAWIAPGEEEHDDV